MSDNTEYRFDESTQAALPSADIKRPCLVMIKGDYIGEVYELTDDVTMIGRSDDVDLTISDISISRRHAMVINRLEGFFISDLSSTNGTFINKELISGPRLLQEGDKVSLGNITFKFSFQDEDDTEYHQMLRNMAVKDGLTRIYNKRYFSELLEKEFDYNRRNKAGLSIVMFDIDHFKHVNDTYGHPAGDFVLKNLAQLVEHEARGYDVFARWGGEEFVFLMRGAPLDAAVALAERVRKVVEEHVFDYDDLNLRVTTSLGVCYWSGDDSIQSSLQLVEQVDKLLYEAKHAGRNCVRYQT